MWLLVFFLACCLLLSPAFRFRFRFCSGLTRFCSMPVHVVTSPTTCYCHQQVVLCTHHNMTGYLLCSGSALQQRIQRESISSTLINDRGTTTTYQQTHQSVINASSYHHCIITPLHHYIITHARTCTHLPAMHHSMHTHSFSPQYLHTIRPSHGNTTHTDTPSASVFHRFFINFLTFFSASKLRRASSSCRFSASHASSTLLITGDRRSGGKVE